MKEYRDYYFLKAKRENYPARSVYKLQEIDAKFHIMRQGMHVLDLGAAPGSWTLWTAQRIGPDGRVLACDLHSIDETLPQNVTFLQENVFEVSDGFAEKLRELGPFDLVMSDMAPRTTGTRFTDQARSYDLACEAFEVARRELRDAGNFVVKIFMSADAQKLLQAMRQTFASVKTFKPRSSRAESKETFFIGLSLSRCTEQADPARSL